MTAAGLIFSNIHDQAIPELTTYRTMASVPFCGRYRLIDFALSNMVNANITKVGVVAHNNYQSLLDHIGTGKDWDLARRSGGIKILPPFITSFDNAAAARLYQTRLEALMGATDFISKCNEDYLVLSDCDTVCNLNLSDVLAYHEKKGADVTVVTKRVNTAEYVLDSHINVIGFSPKGRIVDVSAYANEQGEVNISMNIIVITRTYLLSVVRDALAHGYQSFYRDILLRNLYHAEYYAYPYEGEYALINSMESYFASSMKMLDPAHRGGLFGVDDFPIYTKVRNSAPTKHCEGAVVKNSIVADGCIIEGTVENSILFRGVKIGRGSVVRNSIIMQDGYVGENVQLNCLVADKNVVIKDNRQLSGYNTMPFFIGKGIMV